MYAEMAWSNEVSEVCCTPFNNSFKELNVCEQDHAVTRVFSIRGKNFIGFADIDYMCTVAFDAYAKNLNLLFCIDTNVGERIG